MLQTMKPIRLCINRILVKWVGLLFLQISLHLRILFPCSLLLILILVVFLSSFFCDHPHTYDMTYVFITKSERCFIFIFSSFLSRTLCDHPHTYPCLTYLIVHLRRAAYGLSIRYIWLLAKKRTLHDLHARQSFNNCICICIYICVSKLYLSFNLYICNISCVC